MRVDDEKGKIRAILTTSSTLVGMRGVASFLSASVLLRATAAVGGRFGSTKLSAFREEEEVVAFKGTCKGEGP
jgi:hypothetical protein